MLPERLAKLRIDKKLTHEDMAKKLGITRQGYGNYEAGKRDIDTETLKKLADLFDVDTDYLLGRTDVPKSAFSGRAYYGGGSDWTDEERKLAEAAVEDWRRRKREMEERLKKEKQDGK